MEHKNPIIPSKDTPISIAAYFLYRDPWGQRQSIFWSVDSFYRVSECPILKPLTPCILQTSHESGPELGPFQAPSFLAQFVTGCIEKADEALPKPGYLAGNFQYVERNKIAFHFNPNGLLERDV